MIAFCVTILAYTWRSGAQNDGTRAQLTPGQALGVRIAISIVFGVGLVYFAFIIKSFGRYAQNGTDRRAPTRRRNPASGDPAGTGQPGATESGADERARERGRERRNVLSDDRERDAKSPVVGLGLTGLDGNGVGSPGSGSLSGVVVTTREVDLEKGDFLAGEKGRGRGRISPRL